MPSLRIKRGTRAQINAAATANSLKSGEPYLITDETRLAVGLSNSTFEAAAKFSEIGSRLLFGSTIADGTTLTNATHGNKRLPHNGGTINLPADADWPAGVDFEFVSVGSTPTNIVWAGNAIISADTGSLASQVIGGFVTAVAIVSKISAGVAHLYTGTAKGIDAIAITLGSNPNTPAVGSTAIYNFVNAAGLAQDGLYRFSGIVGPFRVAAIAGNAVTIENVSATVGALVPAGTKLVPTGIKGDPGAVGLAGADGTPGVLFRSGSDITAAIAQIAPTTQAQVANTLRAYPWRVRKTVIITAIRTEVSTLLAGATYRFALYNDNAGYPSTLIAGSDVAAYDAATTGVKLGTFAAPITLTPGLYWIAFNCSGTHTARALAPSAIDPVLGYNPAGGTSANYTLLSVALALAAMPATFTAGATPVGNVNPTLAMFRVQ